MIIAVDFDDTIHDQSNVLPGYRMGQPTPGAVAALTRLVNEGHTVIIFTSRDVQNPAAKKAVADWLDYFHLPYSGITNIKSPAFEVILDNRALRFRSWPQALTDFEAVKAGRLTLNHDTDTRLIDDITQPLPPLS